ncbi:hypothetical protein B0H21DRAFT_758141 [Amylocystis lapponica]|nr:hypothetical protein B0H21DRAFT_758141 [Amylocystis lapponica]
MKHGKGMFVPLAKLLYSLPCAILIAQPVASRISIVCRVYNVASFVRVTRNLDHCRDPEESRTSHTYRPSASIPRRREQKQSDLQSLHDSSSRIIYQATGFRFTASRRRSDN